MFVYQKDYFNYIMEDGVEVITDRKLFSPELR